MSDDSKLPADLVVPPPPKQYTFGPEPNYLVTGDSDDLIAVARAPITAYELAQQVAIAAAPILADPDLSSEGKEKRLADVAADALAKLKALEAKVPAIRAAHDAAVSEIAKAAHPTADAAELQWRSTVLPALTAMSAQDRARRIQAAMIGQGGADAVKLLRAVASVPAFSLGITDVLHEQVREALIETTAKGSAAAARAEKYGRAANSALHALGVASSYVRSIAGAGSGAGLTKLVEKGLIDKPCRMMSVAEKAAFINERGLAAWTAKVHADYGG